MAIKTKEDRTLEVSSPYFKKISNSENKFLKLLKPFTQKQVTNTEQ
jgi:hypothetical protein